MDNKGASPNLEYFDDSNLEKVKQKNLTDRVHTFYST